MATAGMPASDTPISVRNVINCHQICVKGSRMPSSAVTISAPTISRRRPSRSASMLAGISATAMVAVVADSASEAVPASRTQ
ncbi:hypothetical protein D3C86_2090090 [compost metagenome]